MGRGRAARSPQGVHAGELALTWLLSEGRTVGDSGSTRIERVEENVAAIDVSLTPEDVATLDALGRRSPAIATGRRDEDSEPLSSPSEPRCPSQSSRRATRLANAPHRRSGPWRFRFVTVARLPARATMISVDLMIASASSPRRSFRACTASAVITAVSD